MNHPIRATEAAAEAERSLIGCILVDGSQVAAVSATLNGADFLDRTLGRLFELIRDLDEAREPIGDLAFVRTKLVEAGIFEDLGGGSGLGALIHATGDPRNAMRYAAEVKRWSRFRLRQRLASDVTERAGSLHVRDDELAVWLEHHAQTLRAESGGDGAVSDAHRTALDAVAEITLRRSQPKGSGIVSGLWSLDGSIGCFYPGELAILAARPSVGKSVFGAQIGIHNAELGSRVLFVSLEMPSTDIVLRMLAGTTRIDSRRVRAGKVSDGELAELNRAAAELEGLPFYLWNRRGVTVAAIRGMARAMLATGGIALLVVDYLGLIAATDRRKPRWEQITEISGDLKTLALELKIPVLCLCQLNRDAEGQRPKLSHLRDAGAIEQDADLVLLLDRERDKASATIDVAKARNAVTGEVSLTFNSEEMRFQEQPPFEWL